MCMEVGRKRFLLAGKEGSLWSSLDDTTYPAIG